MQTSDLNLNIYLFTCKVYKYIISLYFDCQMSHSINIRLQVFK